MILLYNIFLTHQVLNHDTAKYDRGLLKTEKLKVF